MFDYLIIDESSQVDLLSEHWPYLAAKMQLCRRHQTITTDSGCNYPRKNSGTRKRRCIRLFKHNILSSVLALYPDAPRVILKEHYRCHPKIIGFCNQKYYNGELIPFTKENEKMHPSSYTVLPRATICGS
jgi:hypothetical protein